MITREELRQMRRDVHVVYLRVLGVQKKANDLEDRYRESLRQYLKGEENTTVQCPDCGGTGVRAGVDNDVDPSFLYNLAEKANELLEQKRQRGRNGKYSSLFPAEPVRMCFAEVEAVVEALHAMGVYTPRVVKAARDAVELLDLCCQSDPVDVAAVWNAIDVKLRKVLAR